MSKVARIALAALSVGLCAVAGFATPDAPRSSAADIYVPGAAAPEVATAPPGAAGSAPALWEAPAAILYDNGPLVTHPGGGAGGADASAVQTALLQSTYGFGHALASGFRMADDFTVPAGGWNVTQITFFAYQTGSTTTSTINHINLRIWDGPPGVGSVVFGDTTTNLFAGSSFSNDYRVLDTDLTPNNRPIMADVATVVTFLPAGTYWVDWQTGGTLASGPWAPPVSLLGLAAKPGANGQQFNPTVPAPPGTWSPAIDTGSGAVQDLPFIIEGTVAGGPAITMAKTVGLTAGVCGVDETLTVAPGTPVTYCYTVTNTGSVALNYHTLVDDQLGTVLDNFLFALAPGASTFVTVDDVVLAGTTTNNATWTASETSSSTTVCSSPALAIPDTNPTGANNAIVVGAGAALTALEVSIDATHTWVGDLAFTVTDGTTTAVIVDRPGVPAGTFGCSSDNIDAVLDDSAATPVEGVCAPTPPAIAGTFSPNNPLAAFTGAPFAATWTMTASDAAAGDTGTLNEWCLIAHFAATGVSASDSVTVTVGAATAPDIAVDPSSLSSFQSVDTQVDLNLDITNNGDADLDWTITEDAGRVGNRVVANVPGRQQPILPHRRSTPPAANAVSTGDQTFSRSTTAVAGERTTPVRGEVPDATLTITHSVTQAIVTGNSVSCNAGGLHADNSYLRAFDLPAFGISGGFSITQVEMGIEQAVGTGGTQPVTVNLYTWDPLDLFTFANFALIGTANALVPDQAATIVTVPVTGSAPAGSTLVVEFFTPDGQTAGHSLFVGSNPDGQTAPSYIAAAACGITEPTDTALIGFPTMHLVMNVTGTTGCDTDLTWVSASPAAGTTVPAATTAVTVTFDSTGLVQGATYTGGLCVESNDPDTPVVLVPLTLEVDGMDFSDGFETGDTSRWTVSVGLP